MKGIIKDIVIVIICVAVIWIGLQAYFGTSNPFYVVSSGSMYPELAMYDIIVVTGHAQFDDVRVGDIIVFERPKDQAKVIVHRVVAIVDDDPKLLRTKGDNNQASIPGTDFPITAENYLGTVAYVIPQVGFITKILQPPINYIIIAVIVGIMVIRQISKGKTKKELDSTFGEFKLNQNVDVSSNDEEYVKSNDSTNGGRESNIDELFKQLKKDVANPEKEEMTDRSDEENIKSKDTPEFFLDKEKGSEEKKD
ncbi:Peptidase S24-like protein [Marine Group I thaumarchaeote SCGC AAA799-D07]|nr:Peptidase S24-like protein [Marine Group I thaumarchaeote SCGC AAA799-D07]